MGAYGAMMASNEAETASCDALTGLYEVVMTSYKPRWQNIGSRCR